ncbi:MAG: SUMF1/EgtB/PvdO family nonheme iron enzyme [Balneolaceae bacterium]|nr:SUMF1/EgtB/PvdO family nonheme iron enzyme [Balneolaceae bacterium]
MIQSIRTESVNTSIVKFSIFTCLISILLTHFLHAQSSFVPYKVDVNEPIQMVPIEGGTFVMGDENDNSQQVRVEVNSFWMGSYEITWEQYNQFSTEVMSNLQKENLAGADIGVDADVISLPTPPYVDMSFGMGTDGYPAISMTHYAASMFTKWLTAKTGKFYRLPTEAEWEYVCKASNDNLAEQAWYQENSNSGYQKVGTKEPNQLGLYDIPGNVAEWTTDEYHKDYITRVQNMGPEPVVNPWFQPSDLYPRAVRGASWMDPETEVSCNKRRESNSDWKMLDPQIPKSLWWHTNAQFLGFRIVRPLNEPTPEEMKKYWPEEIDDFGR